jgi:ribosomal protein S24E
MNMEIVKERDMPLLSCRRYTLFVEFKGATPARKQVRDEIAKKVKSDPELTIVKHIYNRYGVERAKVIANVYSKKEDMLKLEDKQLLSKHSDKKPEEKKEQAA